MNTSSRGRRASSFMVARGPSSRASLESTSRRVKRSEPWRAAWVATILAGGVGDLGTTMGRSGRGRLAAALLAVLALAPWLILAFRSRASADDFCFTTLVRNHGWIGAQLYSYQTLGGRYSSTVAITAITWLTDRLGS